MTRLGGAAEQQWDSQRDEDGKPVPVVDREAEPVRRERSEERRDATAADGREEAAQERQNGDNRYSERDAVARRLDSEQCAEGDRQSQDPEVDERLVEHGERPVGVV